jgi:hexosaminidase
MINAGTQNATIRAGTYVSLIRALDTFLQLISNEAETTNYFLNSLPIYIYDEPQYPHRGIQVDTARHYLPFSLIL